MIVDSLENLGLYAQLLPSLEKAAEFLGGFSAADAADGRVEIDGERVFGSVQCYVTKPAAGRLFEAHKKYADLQLVLEGSEIIGWADVGTLKQVSEEYSSGGDIAFYDGEGGFPVRLDAGYFAILFPNDAHLPCTACGEPAQVKKLVIKCVMNDESV